MSITTNGKAASALVHHRYESVGQSTSHHERAEQIFGSDVFSERVMQQEGGLPDAPGSQQDESARQLAPLRRGGPDARRQNLYAPPHRGFEV